MADERSLRIRRKAALISALVGLLMLCMKLSGYWITGSAAILSDALESVVHVAATCFAFYSVLLAGQPPDDSHPYGHGKIEFFSAGLEGTLIVIAALLIMYTAIPKLFNPTELPDLDIGMGITAAAAVINLLLGGYLIRTGQRQQSITLVADGRHVLTDSITSFGVVVGLLLVLLTGWTVLDPIVALAVALNIVITGTRLMRQSFGGLMDEADPEYIGRIADALNRERRPQWIDVHRLRVWQSGEVRHLDFHLTLPYYMQVAEAHQVEIDISKTLERQLGGSLQVLVHHDPCTPSCCEFCAVDGCPVRRRPLGEQKRLTPQGVTRPAGYVDAGPEGAP